MLENFGPRIRIVRKQKGIGLNTFAEKLGVSPGYLSNLETGKTDTVQISFLEKLNNELNLFPIENTEINKDGEFHYRVERNLNLLKRIHQSKPKEAEYLITVLEQGIDLFKIEK